MNHHHSFTALLLVLFFDALRTTECSKNEDPHGQAIIDWVRSKGGIVNPKIQIRRRDPSDPFSPRGLFTTAPIQTNEQVMEIPPSCYIKIESVQDSSKQISMEIYYQNLCRLVHKLMDEWKIYEEDPQQSNYAPYIDFLKTQPTGQLPATYSSSAKAILREIVGVYPDKRRKSALPPWQLVDWIDFQFIKTGCLPSNNSHAEHMAALVAQRGFDLELVPLFDMVNHDNARMNLETKQMRSAEGLKVWAAVDIPAGGELLYTYNYCTECSDVGDHWGTPGIFRDFGFIEDYQVWPLLDGDIWFMVNRTLANQEPIKAEFPDVPNSEGLAFMQEQFSRLNDINLEQKLEAAMDIQPHERVTIEQYYQALVSALKAGIEAILERNETKREEL